LTRRTVLHGVSLKVCVIGIRSRGSVVGRSLRAGRFGGGKRDFSSPKLPKGFWALHSLLFREGDI
jgi:hypothetical protein